MKKFMIYGFALMLLFGCKNYSEFGDAHVRIAVENTAAVFIEARDGNLVTGANVTMHNSTGVSCLLKFSFNEGAYTAPVPPSSDGVYTFTIQSALFSEPYTQNVDHFRLTASPQITLLQDESAHSALAGARLNANEKINVAWSAVEHATVYQVLIGGDALYAGTVTGTATTIPALNTGVAGTYTIMVTAQFIGGDPLFESENFYSYSEKAGSSVLMLTQ